MPEVPEFEFRATIVKQGPNPCIDIPEHVSLAFQACARSGRIHVEGRLNDTPIRGTLIPTGAGRHRLFVNGGMRSAAGVAGGDSVAFTLKPVSPDQVTIPTDVIEGLRRTKGAKSAFEALSPSHRRELLRYIDDARTLKTRIKRTSRMIDTVLDNRPPAEPRRPRRPLWVCPGCGNEFVNKNQYHSCQRYTLAALFAGKPARIRKLFDRFLGMVQECGPVKVLPSHDSVVLMVRVRFARAVPKMRWLDVGFWLPRRCEDSRFHKVETISPNTHVHVLRVTRCEQLDSRVAGWLREAYSVGCQEHLL